MSGRLAIFDCDGTLVDGQAAVCEAMEQAFARIGAPPPPRSAIRRIVGLSLPQAVRQLMMDGDEVDRMQVVEAYKKNFRAARTEGRLHEPLFDGIEALLRRLHADGWALAVATGKSDRGLVSCLTAHGIIDLFSSLQTADRHPSKPDPAMLAEAMFETATPPADTVMIGDTTYDIAAAANAGVRAIGVEWGYHEANELLGAGAIGVARDMEELEAMIRG